jgi:ATP-dependent Clp protease ATP-binding subunit ClpB
LRERLEEKGIILEMTEQVQRHLAQLGYDPVYGARPLKRSIQREVETPIAKEILRGTILEGDHIVAEMKGDQIRFRGKTRGKERKSREAAAVAS